LIDRIRKYSLLYFLVIHRFWLFLRFYTIISARIFLIKFRLLFYPVNTSW